MANQRDLKWNPGVGLGQAELDVKILLVEDDRATRALLEQALSAHYYTVDFAEDGRSALAFVEQIEYDLVLLDIGIPELDGISVCRRLRMQGYQLPILLLTAKDRSSDRVMGLDAGADDYMVKPFHVPELLARIRALLRRGRTTTPSVITWEKVQLNNVTHEIRYGEQLLRLTPKEYGILELLLLNPQRIFSRAAMIDRLWELGEPPTESAISSHIKAIRKKLKAAGASQDLIETMYGFGYRLRPLEHGVSTPGSSEVKEMQEQHSLNNLETKPETKPENLENEEASSEVAEAVMAELWERFKDSFSVQFDLLDQVVVALQNGGLTAELWQEAKQIVHQLVGSLGVFGLSQGSRLAKQIEDLLSADLLLEATEVEQMAQWVKALRQEVNRNPTTHAPDSAPAALPQLPLVLVVDDDKPLTEQLRAEASGRSLHVVVVSNPAAAQLILDHVLPDVIWLNLNGSDRSEAALAWLRSVRQQHPQIPVLVLAEQATLRDRVTAAQLGVQIFLQTPISVELILQQTAQTLHTPCSPPSMQPPPVQPSTASRVMIVDDDPLILHQVSEVLSPWGLQITTLLDPSRFWAVLTRTVPDLLILDIEMPGFTGIELCQVVRNDLQWGNLPILFLTAHQDAETLVQAFAVGGDDYIRKPVLEPELVARVLNRLEPEQIRQLHRSLTQPDRTNHLLQREPEARGIQHD